MLTNIIKSSLCVSKATKASYSFLKSTKSFNAKKLNRNYGIMSFKDVYVKHEYGREPDTVIHAKLREKTSDMGFSKARDIRRTGLVPATLNISGTNKQVLLYINPKEIYSIMRRSDVRFLGYRYLLKIEDTDTEYEVIGSQMDVDNLNYFPKTVTFNTYDAKKLPKPKMNRHAHDIHFQKLIQFPPIEVQRQMKEEGTYKYRRYFKQKSDDDE